MRQGIDEQILILRKLGHRGGPTSLECIEGIRDGTCIDLDLALQFFSGLDHSLHQSLKNCTVETPELDRHGIECSTQADASEHPHEQQLEFTLSLPPHYTYT